MPDHPAARPGHLRVFVDESGDPGLSEASSRWLVLGAVAVLPDDVSVRVALDDIQELRRTSGVLRFSQIRSPAHKHAAYLRLASASFRSIILACDTTAWNPDARIATDPETQYRYLLGFILQRASVLAHSLGLALDFIVEESGHTDLRQFLEYVERLSRDHRLDQQRRFTEWDAISTERIWMVPKDDEPLLSAADAVAHAYYLSLHSDRGAGVPTQPHYADIIQPHLWRFGDPPSIRYMGFIVQPPSIESAFYEEFPHVEEWVIKQRQVAPLLWQLAR